MKTRLLRRVAVAAWLLCLAFTGIAAALAAIGWDRIGPQRSDAWFLAIGITYGTIGCIIVLRLPRNPIGWLILLAAAMASVNIAADFYYLAVLVARQPWPGGVWALWVEGWTWPPEIIVLPVILPLLFPTGHLLSSRWRPALWAAIAVLVANLVVGATMSDYTVDGRQYANPLPGPHAPASSRQGLAALGGLTALAFVIAGWALVARWRGARPDERQQLKWFMLTAGLLAVSLAIDMTVVVLSRATIHLDGAVLVLIAVPFAIAIAVFRYRLYDVDWVITRTLVFAALAALVTSVYVVGVVAAGQLFGSRADLPVSIALTALVAVAFQPVRERMQRVANRLVYGRRATPYELMADLSHRLAAAPLVERLLPDAARAAVEAVGAAAVEARMSLPGGGWQRARWPESGVTHELIHVEPVENAGERLGELAIFGAEPLTPNNTGSLAALAYQLGFALRNVRLTLELQARLDEINSRTDDMRRSRARIVAAADEERRRLVAEISAGTERRLAAIHSGLAAVGAETRDPAAAGAALEALCADASEALDELREVARGVFPPLLADQGFVAALLAFTRRQPIPADLRASGAVCAARFDPRVEAAVYFCCVGALQHAIRLGASSVEASLDGDAELVFSITASGLTRPAAAADGQNLVDRIEAVGGRLVLEQRDGWARLEGRVPTAPAQRPAAVQASASVSGPNSDLAR